MTAGTENSDVPKKEAAETSIPDSAAAKIDQSAGNKILKSTKRKIVPNESRKRALFSCDRCKLRKTGCKRVQSNQLKYDNTTPCIQCSSSGVECTTTIPRKKRVYGPIENIGFHYKCLSSLVSGLFPDKDVNSVQELIELGKGLNIPMPSMDKQSEALEVQDLNMQFERSSHSGPSPKLALPSALPPSQADHHVVDKDMKDAVSALEGLRSGATPPTFAPPTPPVHQNSSAVLKQSKKIKPNYGRERLLVDRGGNTHYIGSQGTSLILNGLSDLIVKNTAVSRHKQTLSSLAALSAKAIRKDKAHAINSENEPVYEYPSHLFNTDLIDINKFPLVNLLNREELNIYTDIFFDKIHPYYFCFNQDKFRKKYEIFWKEVDTIQYNYHSDLYSSSASLSSPVSTSSSQQHHAHVSCRLSNSEICCIYIVWLLGRRFNSTVKLASGKKLEMDKDLSSKFLDIIKLSLLDIVLTPTMNGIRLLFLLAIYLDSLRTKESAWILLELAGRQSISLGIHRKTIVSKFKLDKQDEMKRLLWSLFKLEMSFCAQLGRSSTFHIEEIDISLPTLSEVKDLLFKKYYVHGVELSKIMYQILDNRKPLYLNNEPLSLLNIERGMKVKKNLSMWWDECDEDLKNYKLLPFKRYKFKLHIQFHYYYITLTLPFLLYIINNSNNYKLKKDDPLLGMICFGINSAIKTLEVLTFADLKGFFNGSVYMDIFYGYNAIMMLILTYILINGNNKSSNQQLIDVEFLSKNYQIDLNTILHSINLIRLLNLKNSPLIDGSMKRASDIIEILLNDLGIISVLDDHFGPPVFVTAGFNPNNNLNIGNDNYEEQILKQANGGMTNDELLLSATAPYSSAHMMNNLEAAGGGASGAEPINYSFNNDVLFDSELIDLLFGNENLFNDYNQMNNNINKIV